MLQQNQKKILELCWENGLLNTMERHRTVVKLTGLTKKQIYDWARSRKKKIFKQGSSLPRELFINEMEDFIDPYIQANSVSADERKMYDIAVSRNMNHSERCTFAALCSISNYRIFDYLKGEEEEEEGEQGFSEFGHGVKRQRDEDWCAAPKRAKSETLNDSLWLPLQPILSPTNKSPTWPLQPIPSPTNKLNPWLPLKPIVSPTNRSRFQFPSSNNNNLDKHRFTDNESNFVDSVLMNAFKDGVLDKDENFKLVSTLVDCSIEYIQEFVNKRSYAAA